MISCCLVHSSASDEWDSLFLQPAQLIFYLTSTKDPSTHLHPSCVGATRPPQRKVMPGRNQIRWRTIVLAEETPLVNSKGGRLIIKEVCSLLTCPLCSQHLHFAVSCNLVAILLSQFYSCVPVYWLHFLNQEVMNAAIVIDRSVSEKCKQVIFSCKHVLLSFMETNFHYKAFSLGSKE